MSVTQHDASSAGTASTVAEAFAQFEEALKLDRDEVTEARTRHKDVQDCLTATTMVTSSFLQGSFARKTMVSPLNDVDVVLLLNTRDEQSLRGPGGAARSMEQLKAPLAQCFPGVVFDAEKKADHALRLDFPDADFHIDIVPAFDLGNANGDIDIADRKIDKWEWSNTRQLIRDVSSRNGVTGGRFVPQVQMHKTFTSFAHGLDVCGLIAESLTYDAVTTKMPDPSALLATFERGARLTTSTLTDPTGVDDLLRGWSWERKQHAQSVFAAATVRAREALRLADGGDEAGAVEAWRTLLGPQFPASVGGSGELELLRNWNGVTSTNRVTSAATAAAVATRPVRSHRTP